VVNIIGNCCRGQICFMRQLSTWWTPVDNSPLVSTMSIAGVMPLTVRIDDGYVNFCEQKGKKAAASK
jgi:hypothetical protein